MPKPSSFKPEMANKRFQNAMSEKVHVMVLTGQVCGRLTVGGNPNIQVLLFGFSNSLGTMPKQKQVELCTTYYTHWAESFIMDIIKYGYWRFVLLPL